MSSEQLEDLEQLARRAVACKRWRWMDGMLYKQDGVGVRPVIATAPIIQGGGLPDLSDPATLGCLAALVREATGKPHLFAQFTLDDHWSICDLHDHRSAFVRSEAEAWIEVLEEAAP